MTPAFFLLIGSATRAATFGFESRATVLVTLDPPSDNRLGGNTSLEPGKLLVAVVTRIRIDGRARDGSPI